MFMDKMVIENGEFFARVTELLAQGKTVTIPVKGFSMLPFIRGEKDLVVLDKPGSLSVGDIVLFRIGDRYIMHRIIRMDGNRLEIRGDGVYASTEKVAVDSVCGKAVKILRAGKREVDPYSPCQKRLLGLWDFLMPLRRYLLWFYRHLPWNRKWVKAHNI